MMRRLLSLLGALGIGVTILSAGLGEQIYRKCSRCHGVDGYRAAYDKTRSIATMSAQEIALDLRAYRAGTLDRYGLGRIMHVRLDDHKIQAVSAYIETLRRPRKGSIQKSQQKVK